MSVSTEQLVADWRYRVSWTPLAVNAHDGVPGDWLLLLPPAAAVPPAARLADACAQALTRAGATVRRVEVDGLAPEAALPTAQQAVWAGGAAPAGMLSLLGLDERPRADHPAVTAGLAATLALIRSLGEAAAPAPLWCVTSGAVSVGPEDLLTAPLQAQVWGLGRVAALEHPDRWGGLLDLPAAAVWDTGVADRLLGVLAGCGEDQVAVRAERAFARRVARAAPVAAGARSRWQPRGTVLITGGTGALGGDLARWAAGHGAEHLVLTGRRGPAAPGAAELRAELERAGARVTVAACDVADREALARVLREVPPELPLTAVVHTAGVDRAAALADTDLATLAHAITAKVAGGAHLDELVGDTPLDAFLVFSSIAGIWGGGGGLGAYSAANAYLDALVARRRGRGLAGGAFAWGPWADQGMAADNPEHSAQLNRLGLTSMPPAAAMAALELSLAGTDPDVVIAEVEWERFALAFTYVRPSPLLAELAE
ncbi:beta-ketoacyl reductase [Kitasatospora sp. LaBMicrA B282]|uniref:beta-ketoacyl reductase n=1 Tax=Kitasatospora sp. LaBMicrA B282 TaxID=3420949 RepID=UPI003D12A09A